MVQITPNQQKYVDELKSLITHLPFIIIKGEQYFGKDFIVQNFFQQNELHPVVFKLVDYTKTLTHRLNSQDLISYFDILVSSVLQQPSEKRYIYIRRLDKIIDIVADYQSENRYLMYHLIREWYAKLDPTIKIIVTTSSNLRLEIPFLWKINIAVTHEDINFILEQQGWSSEHKLAVSCIAKEQSLGSLLNCCKYIQAKTHEWATLEPAQFETLYKQAYTELVGSNIDTDKEVAQPIEGISLIGMETILEQIRISILNPIKLAHPDIPVKRGLVLAGPPGTGKTSIGRWLAHELKGKLYLIGGEDGVSGQKLIDTFSNTLTIAAKNAPAIVFVDDVDVLFTNDDTYRAFLTLLDGLADKTRENVCVMVTVMNSRNIPASLIRGNRLEMCLNVSLPNSDTIGRLLNFGWEKIERVSRDLKLAAKGLDWSAELCRSLTIKMTGWNCADINRCINDVIRVLAFGSKEKLSTIFEQSVKCIRDQYDQCGITESSGGANVPAYYG